MSEGCSNCETREHIDRVRHFMRRAADQLIDRGVRHDRSKLESPEAEGFAKCTHALKGLTYGSEEYKEQLKEMRPFLKHHYEHNAHHPEHWDEGVRDMTLMDLIEMLCDWAAATERHADGCLGRSLHVNGGRFEIPRDIQEKLITTSWELFHDKMSAHENGTCNCPKGGL